MRFLKQTGNVFDTLIKILFGLLMGCILFGTLVLDKTVNNRFPNTVNYANGAYYLCAFVLLCLLYRVCCAGLGRAEPAATGKRARMDARTFYIVLGVMAAAVAALQYRVSLWAPYNNFTRNGDFRVVTDGAWALSEGGSLKDFPYFQISPNNLNITIIVSWVYSIIHRPRAAVWLGALLTNASVVLASLAVYNVTKREKMALIVAGVGEVLVALTWRAFLVYTDSYGMVFVALIVWLCTTKIRPTVKIPLIILSAAIGTFIKATNVIAFAALAIGGVVRWLRSEDHRLAVRRMALYAVCFVVAFGAVFAGQGPLRRHYGFIPGEYPKGWQFLFMVGQNTEMLGVVGGGNNVVRNRFIKQYGNLKDVNKACFDEAINRIRERGLLGNIKFYLKKMNVAYNDGYFHNIQRERMYKMDRSFLYDIYIHPGAHYQASATVFQILWDAVLLVMMLYVFGEALLWRMRRRAARGEAEAAALSAAFGAARQEAMRQDVVRFLRIAVLSVTAYLMCLEGRAKYLYMFLPVYLTAFGIMFDGISGDVSAALALFRGGLRRNRG